MRGEIQQPAAPSRISAGLSCGDLVLVDVSAEDLFPADLVLSEVDRLWWPGLSLSRCELAEHAVRPGRVVAPRYSINSQRRWCSWTTSSRSKTSRRRVPMPAR